MGHAQYSTMTSSKTCPVCGTEVTLSASACPECGADDTTGWNEEQTAYDGLDLPDDEFNYDEYLEKEFGAEDKVAKKSLLWPGIIGLTLVVIFIILVKFM